MKYPQVPLQELLRESAENFPEKIAVAHDGQEITYDQLNALSNQFANSLLEMGVEKGDRVAIYLPNIPQFVIGYFGALKAGAVATAISPLHREREVEYQLKDSGAQTIVTLDSLCPIVEKVREKTQVKHVIIAGSNENAFSPKVQNALNFRQLLENSPKTAPKIRLNPRDDLAALQYTGGTTGTAKGAMLTHANLVSNAL